MIQQWLQQILSSSLDADSANEDTFATGITAQTGPVHTQPPDQVFTIAALRRAWLAIKRAGGGAGVDGMSLAQFERSLDTELTKLQQELIMAKYRPRPIRRVLVPKAGDGLRPLAVWALRDRIAQRTVYDVIAPSFEAIFLPCSFGFRPGLSVEDAVRRVTTYRDANLRWVVDADIQNCFDEINDDQLMRLVRRRVNDRLLLKYIQGWLTAKIFNTADGVPRKAGASQGSVLSPLLANVYLHEFDRALSHRKMALVRYADDLVICCRRKSEAQEAMAITEHTLGRQGLKLNDHKSRIVHFDEGFSWLGYFLIRRECYHL